jgi:hypothetical protein
MSKPSKPSKSSKGKASRSSKRLVLPAEIKERIDEATERLASAERELTLAMEAISLPELGADNEMVGERLGVALQELGAARQALALERSVP